MRESLRKFFNKAEKAKEEEVEMKKDEPQPTMAATELASALEALSTKSEALKELTSKYEELSSSFTQMKAALQAFEAEKALMLADAELKRSTLRKEKIASALGESRIDSVMDATKSLDDASFESILAVMSTSLESEKKLSSFNEIGVSSKPDKEAILEAANSNTAKLLQAKYKK